MRRGKVVNLIIIMALGFLAQPSVGAAAAMKPMVQKNCLKCHDRFGKMQNVLAGNLANTSMTAKTMQVKINNRLELVKFTPATEVKNIPSLEALKGRVALRVHYEKVGQDRVAKKIVVKPKIKVAEKQLIQVAELAKLVAQGPEKGGYTLVDSRPSPAYMKGHIPTAVSIPFPKMKEMSDKLPRDKDRQLIFYCQGYR